MIAVAAVAIAQFFAGVLLYRARIVEHWAASDVLVFGTPIIIRFGAHVIAMSCCRRVESRLTTTIAILRAATLSAVVFWISMIFNLNYYGG
jgi:hypothetical protein